MKKALAFMLSLAMIFALCACSATGTATESTTPTEVLTPAPTATPVATQEPESSAADDEAEQSRRAEQSEALTALLNSFATDIQAGSAGSSLKAAIQAARLMDWATTDGADMPEADITAAAESFMQPMSEDERAEFLMQIQSLDSAYQQLQQPGQEGLLESAGVTECGYPWADMPNAVVEALMRALGQRAE